MKYLREYCEAEQTSATERAGAFFAFSKEQYDEGNPNGVKTVHLGAGLHCPVDTAATCSAEISAAYQKGIAADIAENGLEACIRRELANHEYMVTWSISDTANAMQDYPGISDDLIRQVANSVNWFEGDDD